MRFEKAEARLTEEDVRCEKYLHLSSLPRIRERCETELIARHRDIFNSEFRCLLNGMFLRFRNRRVEIYFS